MTTVDESKIKKLTREEHILKRPGRYLGSIVNHTDETYVYRNGKMVKDTITWNPALQKMFDELITNSVDYRKTPEGAHLDTIKVNIHRPTGEVGLNDMITVYDNGGIAVHKHSVYNQYIPEIIFELLAGSNFDDDENSTAAGQNGEGAALTNIFSVLFEVETADGKKMFQQTHSNNSLTKTEPIISESNKNYTSISFIPDYPRLSMNGLSDGDYEKIYKRCVDVAACNPNLKVFFNGQLIKFKSFEDYIKTYTDDYIYHQHDDNWQIAIIKSDGFSHVSFVNTTETKIGGQHINIIKDKIVAKIRDYINKKHKTDIKPSEIANKFQLFVNCTINNPRYSSQTKDELINELSSSVVDFDEKFYKKLLKSEIVLSVLDWIEIKNKAVENEELRKTNKTLVKTNPKLVPKFNDATEKNRYLTSLFLAEGDSAILAILTGRNPSTMGIFPLKGKSINTSRKPLSVILANKEIIKILTITNLKMGTSPFEPESNVWFEVNINNNSYIVNENDNNLFIDGKYYDISTLDLKDVLITDEQYKLYKQHLFDKIIVRKNTLYFNNIVIAADQDDDGHHVTMLVTNMFYTFWPELFEMGVIKKLYTPVAKVTMDKNIFEIYSVKELNEFMENNKDKSFSISYRKGLGTSSAEEWIDYLSPSKLQKNLKTIKITTDEDKAVFDLLFGKDSSERKQWLDLDYSEEDNENEDDE